MPDSFAFLVRSDGRRYRQYCRGRFGYLPWSWMFDPGFVCVFLHRVAHACDSAGWRKLGRLVMQWNSAITGADLVPRSRFGPGLLIPHPCGVTLSCVSGPDLTVGSRAGAGGSLQGRDVGAGPGLPVIGARVRIGELAGAQGGIVIGDDVVVEAGAGAVFDFAPGWRAVLASQPLPGEVPSDDRGERPAPHCPHRSWATCWGDWKCDLDRCCEDVERYESGGASRLRRISTALTNPMVALFAHRLSHWLYARGWTSPARFVAALNFLVFKVDISPRSCIGGRMLMPHLAGTIVDGAVGSDATVYTQCLMMPRRRHDRPPIAGSGLVMAAHSGIIGSFEVGRNVRLAPKVQLLTAAPDGAQLFSPMGRFERVAPDDHHPRQPHRSSSSPARLDSAAYRACRAADRERLAAVAPEASFAARWSVALFRRSQRMLAHGHRRASRQLWRLNMYVTGCDLDPSSPCGPGLAVPHPAGVSFFGTAGAGVTLHAHCSVTVEIDAPRSLTFAPLLDEAVTLEPHSGVFGPVSVGRGARLLPGCVVRDQVGEGAVMSPRRLKVRTRTPEGARPRR